MSRIASMILLPLLLPLPLEAQAPLPAVRAGKAGALQTLTVSLPGTLLGSVPARDLAGRPGLALLVASGKAKSLLFLDPAKPALVRLADGLHEEVNVVVAFDLNGDGGATPIVGMPGLLFAPAAGGKVRQVLEEPHLDLRSFADESRRPRGGDPLPWIPAARAGLLELLAAGPGGTLARSTTFALPQKAERQRWGIRLTSPAVSLVPGEGGTPPLFAVGPEANGKRRLKTTLLSPAGGAAGEPVEAWSLLPGEERLMDEQRYLRIDGQPALAVSTFEKIGIFVQKAFRLYFLDRDLSRKGRAPALAVPTDCALWHPLDVVAADADGDGLRDVALVHPEGLNGNALQLLVYKNLGAGRFDPRPRKVKLGLTAEDWRWGSDLTGDGVPDLLVLTGGKLNLYPGEAGGRPVAARAAWSLSVGAAPEKKGEGTSGGTFDGESLESWRTHDLEVVDVTGDGKEDVVVRVAGEGGRTTLTVVRR